MRKQIFSIITIASILSYAHIATASDNNHLSIIPAEILALVIASAYSDYDHPIEFTYLALVSKTWHAAIKSPCFKDTCEKQRFAEPVMMFYSTREPKKDIVPLKNESPQKQFRYIDPEKIRINYPFNGLFWQGEEACIAIWVNPRKTSVFNNHFTIPPGYADCLSQSKMNLADYIMRCEDGKKLKKENPNSNLSVMYDPITAEPTLTHSSINVKDYDSACAFIATPVLAKRFVKAWPPSLKFEKQDSGGYDYLKHINDYYDRGGWPLYKGPF